MRIALFDYRVIPTNPAGSCHRLLLEELCEEHEFTVFAVEFDNPRPDRIAWVRVPVPVRPLALLFVAFHLVAPIRYLLHRLRRRARFDLVQMVESNLSFGDVCYAHFCHRAFLRLPADVTSDAGGMRGVLRRLDHRLHAAGEPRALRRAAEVVAPSAGLQRELASAYPATRGKVTVIANPVDVGQATPAPSVDRAALRAELGLAPDDVAVAFVALGQFERKGLPLLLDALRSIGEPRLRLIVVGGEDDLVRAYRRRASRAGLGDAVVFTGSRPDVRPVLWAADAFSLPSAYETFSLVTYEAAAAGLPLIATNVHGVEDLLVDRENGFLVERSSVAVAAALRAFLGLPLEEREEMGRRARARAADFGVAAFLDGWSKLYARRAAGGPATG